MLYPTSMCCDVLLSPSAVRAEQRNRDENERLEANIMSAVYNLKSLKLALALEEEGRPRQTIPEADSTGSETVDFAALMDTLAEIKRQQGLDPSSADAHPNPLESTSYTPPLVRLPGSLALSLPPSLAACLRV